MLINIKKLSTKKIIDYKELYTGVNINAKMKEGFLVYPLKNNKTKIFTPTEEDKAFI